VTEKVVRLAPCPVLTIPGVMVGAGEAPAPPPPDVAASRPCLLCGYDGEDLVCEVCRNRIRAEALDPKRESERTRAARIAGLTRKEDSDARS
jgi:hypothetical protein